MNKPEEPSEADCCHSDCALCVFEIYKIQLKKWEDAKSLDDNVTSRPDLISETIFKPFVLTNIVFLSRDIRMHWFKPFSDSIEPNSVLPYNPGQHFVIRCYLDLSDNKSIYYNTDFDSADDSKINKITRPYTVIPQSEENCCFKIVIKLYDGGLMSEYFRKLNIGDITYWRGPYGDFTYEPNTFSNVLMLCMGTGIVPMYAVIKKILDNENDFSCMQLLYGVRNGSDIIFRDELCHFASYWNFKFTYYVSEAEIHTIKKKYCETLIQGRINKTTINDKLKEDTLALVCGSEDFNSTMKLYLIDSKIKDIYIF